MIYVILPLTVKLPPITALPDVVNVESVPTLVIFGCALVVNVPATKFAVRVLPALTLPNPALPVTFNAPVTFDVPVTVNVLDELFQTKFAEPPNDS